MTYPLEGVRELIVISERRSSRPRLTIPKRKATIFGRLLRFNETKVKPFLTSLSTTNDRRVLPDDSVPVMWCVQVRMNVRPIVVAREQGKWIVDTVGNNI
jgi:hypothetical protein